ncbi:flagellar protein FlaG [Psychrobium sp. 1_MG-2023]|uniref:flagellar protein FlaG n=1 Tax=Psychrobium sp. 1_MG-2023 TaxID=3062624 RepID=UPI000C3409FF|nr:flagellar protein FlaG [Psychrobium sp. 1_MG-2023]MDP2559860.1 flagellar protein FlaG [Psychrobium sp. 1_MG-2023]PKF59038.1 hypothetical protein CW748_02285 [Alteromonadales bacterium alter-6D02]
MSIELSLSTPDSSGVSNNQQATNSAYQQRDAVQASKLNVSQLEQAKLAEDITSNNKSASVSEEQPALQKDQLEAMAQKLQDFVGSLNRGLEFSVDEDSGRDVIKVIDKNSGETVRQYPSEEVLDLVASLSDAAGTFVNVKA